MIFEIKESLLDRLADAKLSDLVCDIMGWSSLHKMYSKNTCKDRQMHLKKCQHNPL